MYLAPPDNAVVVSMDEESQIQAPDRTAPILPLRPSLAERRTRGYRRNGTTMLFAALELATGKTTADACYSRHRYQKFLRFLKKVAAVHLRVELHARSLTAIIESDTPVHPRCATAATAAR